MPDFSFLEDGSRQSPWSHGEPELIDTGIVDNKGRRIGFRVLRATYDDGRSVKHSRSVSVTHDGSAARSDDTYHDTFDAAEEEVNRHIARSMQRYRSIYGDLPTEQVVINTRSSRRPSPKSGKRIADQVDDLAKGLDGCGKQLTGCGCLMVLLAILLSLPFLLAGL